MKLWFSRFLILPLLPFILAAEGCKSTRSSAIDGLSKETDRLIIDSEKKKKTQPSHVEAYQLPVSAAEKYQLSVANTATLKVYEGLPHPQSEQLLFENQAKLGNASRISGYYFYTPAKRIVDSTTFKKLLSNAQNIGPWNPKYCGDFHPDYGFEWTSSGKSFFALVCFGCHEIIFSDGVQRLRYDLTPEACYELVTRLKSYAANRPVKTDFSPDSDAPADPFADKR